MRGEYTWVDDETHEATMGAVKTFVGKLQRHDQTDRSLSAVLFTDIVDSTQVQASPAATEGGETSSNGIPRSCAKR